MKKSVITLAKHPSENRYLTAWYKIKTSTGTYQFRSDDIVTPEEEDRLHKFHCTDGYLSVLLNNCLKILTPYLDKIEKHIETEMAKPQTQEFLFSGRRIIKVK